MPRRFYHSRSMAHLRSASVDAFGIWRRRLLFLLSGICIGLAAVLMAKAADAAQAAFKSILAVSPLIALVMTPAGFGLGARLARTVFPNSQGSGIPQVIAARHTKDPRFRHALISLRVAFGKIVVMTLGLLCGAAAGREGPTVQVGAAIMAAAGHLSPKRLPGLILAGGAAGVAAAFNTPLAGIAFGIEELGRTYEARTTSLIVAAIVAAGLTSLWLVGNYTYFGTTDATLAIGTGWVVVPLIGGLGGLGGGLFSRIVILFGRGLPGRAGALIARRPVAFAMLCGLGVALCGLASGSAVYGTGYEEARAILHGDAPARADFAPLKFAATVLTSISGIPGGLFAPSLAVGAGLGAEFHGLFPGISIGALVLIGMVSYLTGVLQAPVTSFVIVTEMTQDHAMMIPLMIAALIADAASKLVCRGGLYHALADIILARADPAAPPVKPAA
ncbi:chloride channel protein [Methylobacterium nodulans]|uniref:Chloride channel core n=1 Tax=Methylobacterium nodulans (strain LMG 21967 / CNCM I-2342 / ORS 2060) TaxID=460265 RepID=B8IA71_METNO|nr:chloride channel protein [Methylobacterium nodulans]ACL59134.1 Chloride channel core [Methylobacterium nodulans ORS 2060]